jgi:hypothetical protein
MFNFFIKNKREKKEAAAAIAAFAAPDITVQKLVERFHSESALCTDVDRRKLLQGAAGVTEEHLALRTMTLNTRQGAAETCMQIKQLATDANDIRASQEMFRQHAGLATVHFAAHDTVVRGLRDSSVAEVDQKLESLSTMTQHVTTATEVLGHNMRALSRSRPRRKSKFRHTGNEDQADVQQALEELQLLVHSMQQHAAKLKEEQDTWQSEWAEDFEVLEKIEKDSSAVAAARLALVA